MSSMPGAVIVGTSRCASIKKYTGYVIRSDGGTALEFHMRRSDSGIKDVGIYARPRCVEHVLCIQRKEHLVDAVQTPGRVKLDGRRLQSSFLFNPINEWMFTESDSRS